jgi:hypothetical protein
MAGKETAPFWTCRVIRSAMSALMVRDRVFLRSRAGQFSRVSHPEPAEIVVQGGNHTVGTILPAGGLYESGKQIIWDGEIHSMPTPTEAGNIAIFSG